MAKKRSLTRAIMETAEILIFAFILSWGLRSNVVEAATIPTPSMMPTIHEQDRVIVDKLFYKFTGIQRDDIIVFNPPKNLDSSGDYWIKRVIGLPGDKVQITGGKVYLNGQPLTEPFEMEAPDYNYGPVIVPKDSYFLLGDNRNHSLDSHYWGALPAKEVEGKAVLRYWPLQRFGTIAK
ncbi:signal peptidase I S [Desulfosporosinus acididurans]|uniref:Signal peptidase I n=1 Tax=Desulfosporosinus acididurans TaxID=476652 RepID=A0A0J1FUK2_9FIRM|nr:signal peptidase I [Desulfosporosinus acididurans]KLU66668.1 signal peptidase I S [Desulfosporosinus acididurans]